MKTGLSGLCWNSCFDSVAGCGNAGNWGSRCGMNSNQKFVDGSTVYGLWPKVLNRIWRLLCETFSHAKAQGGKENPQKRGSAMRLCVRIFFPTLASAKTVTYN